MARKSKAAATTTIGAELVKVTDIGAVKHVEDTPAAPAAVALRGGTAVAAVKLGDKPYRVTAEHNKAWWTAITGALAENGGNPVAVAVVLEAAKCPPTFLGYMLRRGHLSAA